MTVKKDLRWQSADPFAGFSLHATEAFELDLFRWRNDDGPGMDDDENSATWNAPLNTSTSFAASTEELLRLRLSVREYGGADGSTSFAPVLTLQARMAGGTWGDVTVGGFGSPCRISDSTHFVNGTGSNQQLAFTNYSGGRTFDSQNSWAVPDFWGNSSVEIEWALRFTTVGTVEFRILVDGATIPGYIPDIEVTEDPEPPTTAPTNLSNYLLTETEVGFEWTPPTESFSSYDIERNGAVIATGRPADEEWYYDTTVSAGTEYTYRVRIVNADGPGPWSDPITVTTLNASQPVAEFVEGFADPLDSAKWQLPDANDYDQTGDVLWLRSTGTTPIVETLGPYVFSDGDEIIIELIGPHESQIENRAWVRLKNDAGSGRYSFTAFYSSDPYGKGFLAHSSPGGMHMGQEWNPLASDVTLHHRFLRFRRSGSNMLMESSHDRETWSQLRSDAETNWEYYFSLSFAADSGYEDEVIVPIFDNINAVNPAPTIAQSETLGGKAHIDVPSVLRENGAYLYQVEIDGLIAKEATDVEDGTDYILIENMEAGSYSARVRYLGGQWSDPLTLTVDSVLIEASGSHGISLGHSAEARYVFPAPNDYEATAVSETQINLSWSAVEGASAYEVERDGVVIATVEYP